MTKVSINDCYRPGRTTPRALLASDHREKMDQKRRCNRNAAARLRAKTGPWSYPEPGNYGSPAKWQFMADREPDINRWTGQPHEHRREIARNLSRRARQDARLNASPSRA